MPVAKNSPARCTEHPDTCYEHVAARSSIPKRCGGKYTLDQAREVVLIAVAWMNDHGWALPDTADLNQYAPRLQNIDRASLQRVLDDLVRTEDVTVTLHTPPFCRRPRPCYAIATNDRWAEEVDR